MSQINCSNIIMKNIFTYILVLVSLVSNAQVFNTNTSSHSEVVSVKQSKKELHQKLTEWIAINYKSAQDVIQLNTESKIIAKGNYTFGLKHKTFTPVFRIHNTLSFSIKENKYKIDLTNNKVTSDVTKVSDDTSLHFLSLYSREKILSKEEYIKKLSDFNLQYSLKAGLSKKKATKNFNKYVLKTIDEDYSDYLINFEIWNKEINNLFNKIKKYITTSTEEDW